MACTSLSTTPQAASDQLTKLAAQAKGAEGRVGGARGKARVDLEQDVATARASAEAQAVKLQQAADAGRGGEAVGLVE